MASLYPVVKLQQRASKWKSLRTQVLVLEIMKQANENALLYKNVLHCECGELATLIHPCFDEGEER